MEEYEVAIVGGGISGLYCAKKLKDSGVKSIVVLERSNRWGGRLDTDIINIDGGVIKEEKGAMRFTYQDPDGERKSNMPLLSRLIKDLGMEHEIEPFLMKPQPSSKNITTEVKDCNSNYFAGSHFTTYDAEQNPSKWGELYDVKKINECKSADQIVMDIYKKLLERNRDKLRKHFESIDRSDVSEKVLEQTDVQFLLEHQDAQYWAFVRNEFDWLIGTKQTRMRDMTFMDLVRAMNYSDACCEMLIKTLQEGDRTMNFANAGSLLQYNINSINFGNNMYHFKNGMSSLVRRISRELNGENSDVKLLTNIVVDSIQEADQEREGFILKSRSSKTTLKAKHVVIAIPPSAAKAVFRNKQSKLDLAGTYAAVNKVFDSPVEDASLKFILYFNNDWWNKFENIIMFGPNSTDLPCGSVYPLYKRNGDNEKFNGYNGEPSHSALMIYCDSTRAQFWEKFQQQGEKFQSPLQKENSGLNPASQSLVSEALKQLKIVFNIDEISDPILTSYRCWNGKGDCGYAYHTWGVGVDDINLDAAQPVEGKNLYFCNEAWSHFQSYVEGALMSAQNVVNKLVKSV